MTPGPRHLHEALQILAPGTPLRYAIERIIRQSNGALIVLGEDPELEEIANGGFHLTDADFAPARLAELAKMDGAVILDGSCERILRANVHLNPGTTIPTEETGARHRTAERVARLTGLAVVSISESRKLATIFLAEGRHELQPPTEVAARVNQSLQTLERFRRRFDESLDRLTRFEVTDIVVYRNVSDVLRRAELARRIAAEIEEDAVALGSEADRVRLQIEDLTQGIDVIRDEVIRDYVRGRGNVVNRATAALEEIPTQDLSGESVASALGFDHLEDSASSLGYRLLSHVPRLPASVQTDLVRRYRGVEKMLSASAEELAKVSGVGTTRAAQLRRYFDRLIESARLPESPLE